MPDVVEIEYNLSSIPPLGAFAGIEPVTMLVGFEEQPDGSAKVYLGARWKGIYLLVEDPEHVEIFRRGWNSISGGLHCWLWPVPPPDALRKDPT